MNVNLQRRFSVVARQWEALTKACVDSDSQKRLQALWNCLNQLPAQQAASAHAEIETAYFLAEAGFSLSFLEATHGRTADLECYVGAHRLFVEVTVIQSTQGSAQQFKGGTWRVDQIDYELDEFFEQALVKRLLARMAEKAKQLEKYCAPVLLAVSVPDIPDIFEGRVRRQAIPPLDLQRLAGLLIGVLADVPQLSAVLLTLWNAPAQASRNTIRIRQVSWVTRPSGNTTHPRIRLLATNPFARYQVPSHERQMIEAVM